jgi:LPS sulfotransferase NodH
MKSVEPYNAKSPHNRDVGAGPSTLAQGLVVLISHERSGSHFLADMLESTSEITSVDEICNTDAVDPEKSKASFFGFRHQRQIENPDFSLRPDAKNITELLDAYFSHLLRCVKSDKILVDIKYGHVHNFETGWRPSEYRPFLLKYLEKRDVRIVHLSRKDAMATVISSFVAEKKRVWHTRKGDGKTKPEKLHVPVHNLVHDALALEREKRNFFSWLAGNRCHHVAYEEISENDALRAQTMQRLSGFLGLTNDGAVFVSSLEKVTPPAWEIVENYGELRRAAVMFGLSGLPRRGRA